MIWLRKYLDSRNDLQFVFIALAAIVLALTVFNAGKSQDTRKLAAPETTISFSGPESVVVGEEFDVNILITTGSNSVTGAELNINYSPDNFTASKLTGGTFLPNVFTQANINNNIGRASIVLGSNPDDPKQGSGVLATMTLTALSTKGSPSQIGFDPSTAVAALGEMANVVFASSPISINVANPSGATLRISPGSGDMTANQIFSADIVLNTAGKNIDGIDVEINYDSANLEVQDSDPDTPGIQILKGSVAGLTSVAANIADPFTGIIQYSAHVSPPEFLVGDNLTVATIMFKPLQQTAVPTEVSFSYSPGNLNDSNVVETGTALDVLASVNNAIYNIVQSPIGTPFPTPTFQPTAIPTLIPTFTPSPTPTAEPTGVVTITTTPGPISQVFLSLKLVLQGRTSPNASNVRMTKIGVLQTPYQENVLTDSGGNIANLFLEGVNTGSYSLLVKPEGFLQRKFLVSLSSGTTILDTTLVNPVKPDFRGGDLDGSGKINSLDYLRLLRDGANSIYKSSDPLADLDGSGQVNSIDFAIMASNWNLSDEN